MPGGLYTVRGVRQHELGPAVGPPHIRLGTVRTADLRLVEPTFNPDEHLVEEIAAEQERLEAAYAAAEEVSGPAPRRR